MADKPRRASLGFAGGQVLPLRVEQANLDQLKGALTGEPSGWHELETADGAVSVDLAQVVYLRVESDEHRVGF